MPSPPPTFPLVDIAIGAEVGVDRGRLLETVATEDWKGGELSSEIDEVSSVVAAKQQQAADTTRRDPESGKPVVAIITRLGDNESSSFVGVGSVLAIWPKCHGTGARPCGGNLTRCGKTTGQPAIYNIFVLDLTYSDVIVVIRGANRILVPFRFP
jgi:hypothetical protein